MSQYANDLLPQGGWDTAYRYLQTKHDLMPMWIPSDWRELALTDGAGITLSCQMNRDMWAYRIKLNCIAQMGEELGEQMVAQPPLYLEYRISVNGMPVSGWIDAYMREGGYDKVGLGAGFIVPQGKAVTVDVRRVGALAQGAEAFEHYLLQLTVEGCELYPPNAGFYEHGQQNQILDDWQQKNVLRPMWYSDRGTLDLNTAGTRVALRTETDNDPFLLNRIQFITYPDFPVAQFIPPLYEIPADAHIYIDNRPLNDHREAVACSAWGGVPLFENHIMRVPLLIPPRSRIFAHTGGWPWTLEKTVQVAVILGGHKIIASEG